MHKFKTLLPIFVLATFLVGCAENMNAQTPTNIPAQAEPTVISGTVLQSPPAKCPVAVPPDPAFKPPAPYDALNSFKDHFWYGSSALWTTIPVNGTWNALPHNPEGYTQKILWWRDGYVWDQEPEPNLFVTGERLDESAPPLIVDKATNAYASDIGSAMMVGVDFPTLGCWKITGKYNGAELSFVIWVAP